MTKKRDRNRPMLHTGIAPVISTILLVGVAIAVTAAVVYWFGGMATDFMISEELQTSNIDSTPDSYGNWMITANLKNTGANTITVSRIEVNDNEVIYGQLAPTASVSTLTTNMVQDFEITSGATVSIEIYVGRTYATLSSGTMMKIIFASSRGVEFLATTRL